MIPWMQDCVTEWEVNKDPDNTKTLLECQTCFVKHAGRHCANQKAMKDAGIVNQADAVDKRELEFV